MYIERGVITNTLYLKYALEIESVGSITQAAQNLYMAQPNLSKAIKELEKEVGFTIFRRTSVGVKVTEEGAELLYHAKQIMEQLDAVSRIGERSGNGKLNYKISIPRGSYIVDGFTSFVSEVEHDSGMEITIHETNTLGTIGDVVNRNYNVGIIRYQSVDDDYYIHTLKNNHLEYETIWEFEFVLVMSRNHPLATKEEITLEDLRQYTKITHGDVELPHDKQARKIRKGAVDNVIYVYERGSQFDLLANVPSTYMWVSPIPQSILDKNNLIQKVCKVDTNRFKDVIVYRNNYDIGDCDRLFLKKIYESKVDVSSTRL